MSRLGLAWAGLLAAVLVASPVALRVGGDGGVGLATNYAFAKHGGDDRGRDDRGGHRRDDRKNDDRKKDDDRKNDDRGRGRGGDDDRPGGGGTPGGKVVKVEQSGRNIEVVYANGVKEEIEHGRYERKNAAGDTVVERPATQADRRRLQALAR